MNWKAAFIVTNLAWLYFYGKLSQRHDRLLEYFNLDRIMKTKEIQRALRSLNFKTDDPFIAKWLESDGVLGGNEHDQTR